MTTLSLQLINRLLKVTLEPLPVHCTRTNTYRILSLVGSTFLTSVCTQYFFFREEFHVSHIWLFLIERCLLYNHNRSLEIPNVHLSVALNAAEKKTCLSICRSTILWRLKYLRRVWPEFSFRKVIQLATDNLNTQCQSKGCKYNCRGRLINEANPS